MRKLIDYQPTMAIQCTNQISTMRYNGECVIMYKDPIIETCDDWLSTSHMLLECNENKQEREKLRMVLNINWYLTYTAASPHQTNIIMSLVDSYKQTKEHILNNIYII